MENNNAADGSNAALEVLESKYIKLDYSIEKPEDRVQFLKKLLSTIDETKISNKVLEQMSDYIIFADEKEKRKDKKILTANRLITVNKNETSFEGLVAKFEAQSENGLAGGDSIYNHIIQNDKNILLTHKISITEEDIAEVPGLRSLREDIAKVEAKLANAKGRAASLLVKQLIEMRKDQYVLKNNFRRPIHCINTIKSFSKIDLSEKVTLDEKGEIHSTGLINFYNPSHISLLLCNYSKIKEDSWDNFSSDSKWLMMDFDALVDKTLKDKYPLFYKLIIYKIDGMQNAEIQQKLEEEFGIKHSVEYISCLWRNKIPKLIAEQAKNDWLEWHYTFEEKGKWKRCGRCGKIKLAHNNFFSKNTTSKDGYYSICKECRNKRKE